MTTCPYCGQQIKDTSRKINKNHVKKGTISPIRINNIITAFNHITWDANSVKITIMGYGDRPAFTMDGVFKKHDGIFPDIKVQFHTFTPGGGQSRLYFWVKEKRYRITAALVHSRKVTLKMLSKYHQLLGKEYEFNANQSGYGYLFNE